MFNFNHKYKKRMRGEITFISQIKTYALFFKRKKERKKKKKKLTTPALVKMPSNGVIRSWREEQIQYTHSGTQFGISL